MISAARLIQALQSSRTTLLLLATISSVFFQFGVRIERKADVPSRGVLPGDLTDKDFEATA